jgi:hypothetical protein
MMVNFNVTGGVIEDSYKLANFNLSQGVAGRIRSQSSMTVLGKEEGEPDAIFGEVLVHLSPCNYSGGQKARARLHGVLIKTILSEKRLHDISLTEDEAQDTVKTCPFIGSKPDDRHHCLKVLPVSLGLQQLQS